MEEIEAVFQNRCKYVSKKEAAKSMGMTTDRVYKLQNELYRIRIEKERVTFKAALNCTSSRITTSTGSNGKGKTKNKTPKQPGDE